MNFWRILLLAGLLVFAGQTVQAASLRVSPVTIDVQAPAAAGAIRVWNDDKRPLNVQIRVFRWVQRDGRDAYEPAPDVVASPPMVRLAPGAENLVRIVRTSNRPLRGEESYRVVVDEVPDRSRRRDRNVVMVLRHSIPAFFGQGDLGAAKPSFTVTPVEGGYRVSVTNAGQQRIRLANLVLRQGDKVLARKDGLTGYVLANSAMSWVIPGRGRASGGKVTVNADSDQGRINTTARLGSR